MEETHDMAKDVSNIIEQLKLKARVAEEALKIVQNEESNTGHAAKQTVVDIANKLSDVKSPSRHRKHRLRRKRRLYKIPKLPG